MLFRSLLARDYKGKLDKEADRYIAYAVEGSRRMEDLLKGMRELWQAGERGEEHETVVDCNEVLKKVLLNLHKTIADSGAIVTHEPLPTVWAEETGLVQVFQNLVGNAIKYRSKKRPEVDRKSTRLNSSHGYITYAVFCMKKKKQQRSANPTGVKTQRRRTTQQQHTTHTTTTTQ